ncbi:MAG: CRISPR-associated protein Cas5 [Candidatus Magnetomorum sp.]|nr:CRISPR-associated protein Cas5 [Candidatus Magnetomorum sp.]
MPVSILKILSFRVSGRFAHFRKFYTNSSSLSYFIPPRTAIIGMLGSILQYERDSYYDIFNPDDFRISVSVTPGTSIKKQMQCMNYLHEKYYDLLVKGKGKKQHSQCRLELLMADDFKPVDYTLYIGVTNDKSMKILSMIEKKLINHDHGFGVFLGQRQFRADIHHLKTFENISCIEISQHVDSICIKDFAQPDLNSNLDRHLIVDRMPIHLGKKIINQIVGRELDSIKNVMYEKNGQRIFGIFKDCYPLDDKRIAFFET